MTRTTRRCCRTLALASLALASVGCLGEIGIEEDVGLETDQVRPALSAYPGLTGPEGWMPLRVNGVVLDVPYMSIQGFHVVGGDALLPSSPALSMGADDAGAEQEDLSRPETIALTSIPPPNDTMPEEDRAAELEEALEDSGDEAQRSTFGATVRGVKKWAYRRVPYAISPQLSSKIRSKIFAAMNTWTRKAGFRFFARKKESSYLFFVPSGGCSSYVGRIGGRQKLWLATWAWTGAVVHELGHAIGLHHEHQRDDRDKYIRVDYSNVPKSWRSNMNTFRQLGQTGWNLTGYDSGSLMHYSSYTGSASNPKRPWLTRRDGRIIQQPNEPTAQDVRAVNLLYK